MSRRLFVNGKPIIQPKWVVVGLTAAAVFGLSFLAQRRVERLGSFPVAEGMGAVPYRRIISLAPSITETLFAIGLGDAVVGVTRYCDYPPEARSKRQVGGVYDPNYEAITALSPDLVMMLPVHEKPRKYLEARGVKVLTTRHETVAEILESIRQIGRTCGVPDQAEAVVQSLRRRMDAVAAFTRGLDRPSIMVGVGRNIASNRLEDIYIAGKGGFYDQLIGYAGGVNAYAGSLPFPAVSAEGILKMNPAVIVEMLGNMSGQNIDPEQATKAWQVLPRVDAVRNGRVHLIRGDFAVVPGPRFILILEKLARALHPELDWEAGTEHRDDGPPKIPGNAAEQDTGGLAP